MKKNVLITIVVILVVAVLVVGAVVLLNNKKEEKTIDVEVAGQTLANSTPFNELATMDITTEELGSLYGINTENVEKVVGKMPMMNVQASMYLIIQAKEGTVDTVKAELDAYAYVSMPLSLCSRKYSIFDYCRKCRNTRARNNKIIAQNR